MTNVTLLIAYSLAVINLIPITVGIIYNKKFMVYIFSAMEVIFSVVMLFLGQKLI